MRFLPLLMLSLGCQTGAPCSWTVTNETGENLVELYAAPSRGSRWRADILEGTRLAYGERVNFDVEADGDHDLRAVGEGGDAYVQFRAQTCDDGEDLDSRVTIADRER